MSTLMESQTRQDRTRLYLVLGIVLVAAMVLGLFLFKAAKSTQDAQDKADQLITELQNAGATVPTQDQIVNVLGDDGGAVCTNPNNSLNRAILLAQLGNGASGPGIRPVIADSRVVQGQKLIMQVYCPDQLAEFQQYDDGLKFDDVAG